jgi:hypothetical protein
VNERAVRIVVGAVLPAFFVVLAITPWLVAWSDLPERVAKQWALDGVPRSSIVKEGALAYSLVLTLIGAIGMSGTMWRRGSRANARSAARGAAVFAFVGAVSWLSGLVIVAANRDQATWRTAELSGAGLPVVIGGALLIAVAVIGLAQRVEPAHVSPTTRPRLPVAPGELLAWTGRASGRGLAALACVTGVVTVGVGATGSPSTATIFLIVTVVVGLFASVRVTVGVAGVRVTAGTGWPRLTLPLERIEVADSIDVRPMEWGGWGYRGSLRLAKKAAWVLRRGPGLHLSLRDGGTFVVTVDDAPEAAAVVNALLPATSTPR